MSKSAVTSEALFEGGPTIEQLGDPSSSWHVYEGIVDVYRELIPTVVTRKKWRELERLVESASTDSIAGTVLYSWRAQAMAARGERVMPDRVPPLNEGWSDAGANVVGFGMHLEVVNAAGSELHSREFRAALAASTPPCSACAAVAALRDGLCEPCNAAKRWITIEADRLAAAEKVGGKFTGRSREDLVRAYLAR